jgi:hypothetical protein
MIAGNGAAKHALGHASSTTINNFLAAINARPDVNSAGSRADFS